MSTNQPSSAKAAETLVKDFNERPFLYDLAETVDMLKHRLPCCPNCDWWDAREEICRYQGLNQRPPAPVIAFGCAAYVQDVPF